MSPEMEIKQILDLPEDTPVVGLNLTVEHCHKYLEIDDEWVRVVTFEDSTGQIQAWIVGGKLVHRKNEIIIHEGLTFEHEGIKCLYVKKWDQITSCEPDPSPYDGKHKLFVSENTTIRSKIKCWQVAAKIESGATDEEVLAFAESECLVKIIDAIMNG